MKSDDLQPVIVVQPEDPSVDEQPTASADKPVDRQHRSQRQLKDYPQSLQTAARALWG